MPNAALIRETGAVHRGVELLHKSPDFFFKHNQIFFGSSYQSFQKTFRTVV